MELLLRRVSLWELVGNVALQLATSIFTFVLLVLYIRKTLPSILTDVAIGAGESISEKLNETFANPNVKRAMTVLGKQSGEVRADNALREKVATAIVDQSPVISMALEKIGITPLEGMKILNDPIFGNTIKGFIGSFAHGAQGFMGQNNPGQRTLGKM